VEKIAYSEVQKIFDGMNCPQMDGKPKLFFIQACQGMNFSRAATNFSRENKESKGLWSFMKKFITPEGEEKNERVIVGIYQFTNNPALCKSTNPNEQDQLIFGCSYQDCFSIRDKNEGSWFIQDLCKVMNAQWDTKDLNTMLNEVKREVASRTAMVVSKINATAEEKTEICKQMPCVTSTLVRNIAFYL